MWPLAGRVKIRKTPAAFFVSIDEGQYLNGIVAGHMSQSKSLALIAAKPVPQVLRNLNRVSLSARRVDPTITVTVIFTGDRVAAGERSGGR